MKPSVAILAILLLGGCLDDGRVPCDVEGPNQCWVLHGVEVLGDITGTWNATAAVSALEGIGFSEIVEQGDLVTGQDANRRVTLAFRNAGGEEFHVVKASFWADDRVLHPADAARYGRALNATAHADMDHLAEALAPSGLSFVDLRYETLLEPMRPVRV